MQRWFVRMHATTMNRTRAFLGIEPPCHYMVSGERVPIVSRPLSSQKKRRPDTSRHLCFTGFARAGSESLPSFDRRLDSLFPEKTSLIHQRYFTYLTNYLQISPWRRFRQRIRSRTCNSNHAWQVRVGRRCFDSGIAVARTSVTVFVQTTYAWEGEP